jgi:hypothetical protein
MACKKIAAKTGSDQEKNTKMSKKVQKVSNWANFYRCLQKS